MLRHESRSDNFAEPELVTDPSLDETVAPLWFEYLLLAGGCFVLFAGGFGLLLAVMGDFSAPRAFLLGGAGTIAGIALCRPRRQAASVPGSRPATVPAAIMVAIAGGIAIWNSRFEGYHVVVDSDPGVYATTGRWLADHSGLIVPAGAPWASTGLQLSLGSAAGMYQKPGGTLDFQFAHFWPVLLAEAYRIGGATLMFQAPAVTGGLALLAIYAVGCRLIRRPWVVVVVVTALGVSLPELAVNRDPLSETSTQLLLWFGIWLLIRAYEERRFLVSLIAGLAIGGTLMTHIDAVIYLAPLPLLGAVAWAAGKSSLDRRSLLRVFAGVVLGALPSALLGTIDLQRRAGRYYDDLHSEVTSLYRALALAAAVALIIAVLWPRIGPVRDLLSAQRRRLGIAAGWIVGTGLLLAWSLRPSGPKTFGPPSLFIKELQAAENVPLQPGRTYAEQTMRWISWYVGPIGLALAIAGVSLLTARVIMRGLARWVVVLAMTGPVTALYLWRPSVNPYQIWAMRRFVPAALPFLLLAAGMILDSAASLCVSRLSHPAWGRRVLTAGAAGLIAFPLAASLPLRSFQPQADSLTMIDTVCQTIGPDAAVLFPAHDFEGVTLTQDIRSWCNDPAALLTTAITPSQLRATNAALRSQGRTLWVLGSNAQSVMSTTPDLAPQLLAHAANNRQIRNTLTRPANSYGSDPIAIWGAMAGS